MADFRPFSPRWGDISFTEAPQTTARCYAGVIFLSYSPSGRHREPAGVEGAARHGAWPRRRWAVAGPGRTTSRRAEPHISDQAPLVWRVPEDPEGLAAVPVGGGGAWQRCRWAAAGPGRASARPHTKCRRCGGRRRDRRARAGFEIDTSEPSGSRVAISRAAGPDGAWNTSGAASNNTRRGRLAGGPPPTGTQSSPAQQAPGYAKGAGTEVPAPCRLTQPLPRRGSGRMILSPGDGDASTGTCRPRRPLPGPLRRSGRRSRCGRGPSSAWWPGRRARRNRS